MDLKFLFYVFLCIVVISGGSYNLFGTGQEIAAGIFFFGAVTASVFFGIRWFTSSGDTRRGMPGSGAWPPLINYCPDFLTLHVIDNKQVCIDTIGVARAGGIEKWTSPTQIEDKYKFNLYLDRSDKLRLTALCEEAAAKKVTWEGVYDGSVCLGNVPPVPPAV